MKDRKGRVVYEGTNGGLYVTQRKPNGTYHKVSLNSSRGRSLPSRIQYQKLAKKAKLTEPEKAALKHIIKIITKL